MAEDEMVGWHHQLNEHEFEKALGDGEEQGSLACCSRWGHKELDATTPQKGSYDQPRQHIKKQRHCFASEGSI